VVCESARKSKGTVTGGRSADFFFFFENPWIPGGRASPGLIIFLGGIPKFFFLFLTISLGVRARPRDMHSEKAHSMLRQARVP
jgi:hypothetical protein